MVGDRERVSDRACMSMRRAAALLVHADVRESGAGEREWEVCKWPRRSHPGDGQTRKNAEPHANSEAPVKSQCGPG